MRCSDQELNENSDYKTNFDHDDSNVNDTYFAIGMMQKMYVKLVTEIMRTFTITVYDRFKGL